MISTEVSRHDFEIGTSLSSNKRKSIFAMLAFSQRNHLDQIKVVETKCVLRQAVKKLHQSFFKSQSHISISRIIQENII